MNRDDVLVAELASGQSVAEASRRAGCSLRTTWRKLEDASFRERIQQARRDAFGQAVGVLQTASIRAAETLRGLLDDPSPGIKLRAATAILETASRLGEIAQLEERLAALEAA